MSYKLKYFASLREKSGKSEEDISKKFSDLNEVYAYLDKKYRFGIDQKNIRASVNGEYCDFSRSPSEDDLIVFIPPVAGG